MTINDHHIFSFTCGPFQVTLYPTAGSSDRPTFAVDLYHSGSVYTHPRFICTREEVEVLAKLSAAADTLVREYLNKGRTFTDWCVANKVNPFDPELAA